MKYLSTAILTILALAFLGISFLHLHSDDYSFSLILIPKVEDGKIESQRYVQYSGDPGSLLFGYRHEIKQGKMELPRVNLSFTSKTESELRARGENKKEGKKREYTFGFSKRMSGEKSSDFYGSYTFVQFWVIELGLVLVAIPFIFPFFPLRNRKAETVEVDND